MLEALPRLFAVYGLTVHPTKTRLVDFRQPPYGQEPDPPPSSFDSCREPTFTHTPMDMERDLGRVSETTRIPFDRVSFLYIYCSFFFNKKKPQRHEDAKFDECKMQSAKVNMKKYKTMA